MRGRLVSLLRLEFGWIVVIAVTFLEYGRLAFAVFFVVWWNLNFAIFPIFYHLKGVDLFKF